MSAQVPAPFVDGDAVNIVRWWNRFLSPMSDALVAITDADDDWTNLTLKSGFTSYGSPYPTAGYKRVRDIVHLRGLIAVSPASTAAVFATLPGNLAPTELEIFLVVASGADNARIDVRQDADLDLVAWQSGSSGAWFSLDNISYSIS